MKILSIIGCVLFSLVAFGQAPSTNLPATHLATALVYTNGWADNSTNSTPSGPLNVTRYEKLGWQIRQALSGSGTATNHFDFECSLDNTNWPGTYFYTVSLVANGTNAVQTNLTMNVEAQGYIRLSRARFGNNSGSYPTNLQFLYSPKPFPRN